MIEFRGAFMGTENNLFAAMRVRMQRVYFVFQGSTAYQPGCMNEARGRKKGTSQEKKRHTSIKNKARVYKVKGHESGQKEAPVRKTEARVRKKPASQENNRA